VIADRTACSSMLGYATKLILGLLCDFFDRSVSACEYKC